MQSLNCVIFVHSSNFIVLFFCFTAKCEYLFGLFVLSHNLYSYSYYSWNLLPSLAQFLTMPLSLNHTLLILQFFCQCACVSFCVRFQRVVHRMDAVFYLHYFGLFFVMLVLYRLISIARQVSWIFAQGNVLSFQLCPSYCFCWSACCLFFSKFVFARKLAGHTFYLKIDGAILQGRLLFAQF